MPPSGWICQAISRAIPVQWPIPASSAPGRTPFGAQPTPPVRRLARIAPKPFAFETGAGGQRLQRRTPAVPLLFCLPPTLPPSCPPKLDGRRSPSLASRPRSCGFPIRPVRLAPADRRPPPSWGRRYERTGRPSQRLEGGLRLLGPFDQSRTPRHRYYGARGPPRSQFQLGPNQWLSASGAAPRVRSCKSASRLARAGKRRGAVLPRRGVNPAIDGHHPSSSTSHPKYSSAARNTLPAPCFGTWLRARARRSLGEGTSAESRRTEDEQTRTQRLGSLSTGRCGTMGAG